MHVVFLAPRLHTNYSGLISALGTIGCKVSFIVAEDSNNAKKFANMAIHTIPFLFSLHHVYGIPGLRRFARSISIPRYSRLAGLIKNIEPDVIILRNRGISTIFAHWISQRKRIKTIQYDQSGKCLYNGDALLQYLLYTSGSTPRCRFTTAVGRKPRFIFLQYGGDFVPFSVDPLPPRKWTYHRGVPVKFLVIGKLGQARKNLPRVVDALAPLLRAGEARLTIVGAAASPAAPAYRDLLAGIDRHAVGGAVEILSDLDHEACLELYAKHDVFVLASRSEPAAISPLEAMASGLPVICTMENGTNYVVEHGINGFLFDPKEFGELTRFARVFVDDHGAVERMGRRAAATLHEHFDVRATADAMAHVLRKEVVWPSAVGIGCN